MKMGNEPRFQWNETIEPVTVEDYEDVKATIKQLKAEESKRENWPEYPICQKPMKEGFDKEFGKVFICTNHKCTHWE